MLKFRLILIEGKTWFNLLQEKKDLRRGTVDIELQMIRAWLFKIDEPEEKHSVILNKCRSDPEALEYFFKHALGELGATYSLLTKKQTSS